ncbi:MAG: hypothetical protein IJ468_14930 [Lachnospiraceae bacterium]|nr:hypothetical protein [Lachnospiraceae bacterium]
MVISGKEIRFSPTNRKDAAKLQQALDEMSRTEEKIQTMREDGDVLEMLDMLIGMFRQFFITTTGVDVVGTCEDAAEAAEMYNQFLSEVAKQKGRLMNAFSPKRVK